MTVRLFSFQFRGAKTIELFTPIETKDLIFH